MSLFDKFKALKKQEDNNSVNIYNIKFPFYISLSKMDFDEENGDEPIKLNGMDAYRILTDDVINEVCSHFENSELYKYWPNFNKKIIKMQMRFIDDGYIIISISVKNSLSDYEKQELLKLISGQMSDGWGEEDFYYEKENGEQYTISFWDFSDWYIKFI